MSTTLLVRYSLMGAGLSLTVQPAAERSADASDNSNACSVIPPLDLEVWQTFDFQNNKATAKAGLGDAQFNEGARGRFAGDGLWACVYGSLNGQFVWYVASGLSIRLFSYFVRCGTEAPNERSTECNSD